jgi:hypothetical protein
MARSLNDTGDDPATREMIRRGVSAESIHRAPPPPRRLAREMMRRGLLRESEQRTQILQRLDVLESKLIRAELLAVTDDEHRDMRGLRALLAEARAHAAVSGAGEGAQEAYEVVEWWFLSDRAEQASTLLRKTRDQRATATRRSADTRVRKAAAQRARYVAAAREIIEHARRRGNESMTRPTSVAEHLATHPPRGARRLSARQILRYLGEELTTP